MKTKTEKTNPKVEVKKEGVPNENTKNHPQKEVFTPQVSNHCKFHPLPTPIYKLMQQRERGCPRKPIQAGLLLVSC